MDESPPLSRTLLLIAIATLGLAVIGGIVMAASVRAPVAPPATWRPPVDPGDPS